MLILASFLSFLKQRLAKMFKKYEKKFGLAFGWTQHSNAGQLYNKFQRAFFKSVYRLQRMGQYGIHLPSAKHTKILNFAFKILLHKWGTSN